MQKEQIDRVIMQYQGHDIGPLLIVIAAIHGNEDAGIHALSLVHKMLEVEPITNPKFSFKGKVIGLVGNVAASKSDVRYIDKDLNRIWNKKDIDRIQVLDNEKLCVEEKEQLDILTFIRSEIKTYQPTSVYILDLHTTSSAGGIFTIPNEDPESLQIASSLHAPVILGMLKGISGTTLHYFNKNLTDDLPITSVTFEAGQHDDPSSINRCIAAIITLLRSIGSVSQKDVENIHDNVLINYAQGLPSISTLLYKHIIKDGDDFQMKPGFKNFEKISKNQLLATDVNGDIRANADGMILMPLYQTQGSEGFYVIKPIK